MLYFVACGIGSLMGIYVKDLVMQAAMFFKQLIYSNILN
jgi:hypothetical protein